MPWFVDTPVVPELLVEKKGDRDEGLCKVLRYRDGRMWNFPFFFQDRVSLCSSGCPGTHSVGQAGIELQNPPASASQVVGLKASATTAQ